MPDSRSSIRDAAVWLVCCAPALLLLLHGTAILPIVWERQPLGAVQAADGRAYVAVTMTEWMSRHYVGDSPAQVLEDGRPLPIANADLKDISTIGAGRFSMEEGRIYFSTPDNSDPRINGRHYELNWPMKPSRWFGAAVVVVGAAATFWFFWRWRTQLLRFVARPPFWVSAAVFLVLTVAARAWYFQDFPIPGLYGDSTSYFGLVHVMDLGQWPQFTIRTPGYPLFLKLIFTISNRTMAVVVAQNLITVASGLALIYAFHVLAPLLGLWAALAMSIFTIGLWSIENDTSILSDSPYSGVIMLVFAFVILGVTRRKPIFWALASTAMATVILIRPAGMFLFVIYLFCLAFLWHNRIGLRSVLSLALPLPIIILMLCAYNYATFGSFAMSAFGESQIGFATFTFWEEDPSYPANVNETVRNTQRFVHGRLTDEQRELLQTSWDFRRLVPVFLATFNYPTLDQASTVDGKNDYLTARHWIQKVSLDSIRKHPVLYTKFVLTQLWLLYVSNIVYQDDFINQVRNRIVDVYGSDNYTPGQGNPLSVDMAKEFAGAKPLPTFSISGEGAEVRVTMSEASVSRRLFRWMLQVRRPLSSTIFVWGFVLAIALSTLQLFRSGFHHTGAFIGFIITMSMFGASLVVALVEYGGYRYSYVMEYVYYLPILALPFIGGNASNE